MHVMDYWRHDMKLFHAYGADYRNEVHTFTRVGLLLISKFVHEESLSVVFKVNQFYLFFDTPINQKRTSISIRPTWSMVHGRE